MKNIHKQLKHVYARLLLCNNKRFLLGTAPSAGFLGTHPWIAACNWHAFIICVPLTRRHHIILGVSL